MLSLDCSSLGCLYPQPLYSPFSLICTIARTVFIQPPGPSLSSNRWVQTGASQGREGIWRRWKSSQKTMVEPWGRVLDPPQGTRGTESLSCFADTETPRWVGEVNCILPTSMQTPDVLESEGWWCWLPLPLEKRTTTPSSILSWRIPWTEEPGRLQFKELQRVGHDWAHPRSHYLTTNQSEERPRADHSLLDPLL